MNKVTRFFCIILCSVMMLNITSCGLGSDVTYVKGAFSDFGLETCTYIMKDKEELDEFISTKNMSSEMKENLLKYEEDFFEDDMIIVISTWETSGSYILEVKSVEHEGAVAKVILEREVPEDATDDMKNWGIIIETEKNDSITEVTVKVEEQ